MSPSGASGRKVPIKETCPLKQRFPAVGRRGQSLVLNHGQGSCMSTLVGFSVDETKREKFRLNEGLYS